MKGYVTTKQAAALAGVSTAMVKKLIRGNGSRKAWAAQGAEYVGRIWLIPEKLVKAYIAERA